MTGGPAKPGEPAAAGELGVQPAPGHDADLPVPLVVPGQFLVRVTPGGRVLAFEPVAAVLAGPARPARHPGRRVPVHDPVVAQPDQHLHPVQVLAQIPGQRGLVIPRVVHVQRDPPLPGRAQPRRVRDDLLRGLAGGVVPGPGPDLVLRRGPRPAIEAQLGQPLERPPGHHRTVVAALAGMMMPFAARAGGRCRPRVGRGIDREHQRPLPRPPRHQQVPQRLLIDAALGQPLVNHAVAAAEHRLQAQIRQRDHRPGSQHRVRQLKQSIRAPPQAPPHLPPEPSQIRQRIPARRDTTAPATPY